MENKEFEVFVSTSDMRIVVEAEDADQAEEIVKEGLERGAYTCEADETYFCGYEVFEIK